MATRRKQPSGCRDFPSKHHTQARGFFSSRGDTCRRASEGFCDVAEISCGRRSPPSVLLVLQLIWRKSSLPT